MRNQVRAESGACLADPPARLIGGPDEFIFFRAAGGARQPDRRRYRIAIFYDCVRHPAPIRPVGKLERTPGRAPRERADMGKQGLGIRRRRARDLGGFSLVETMIGITVVMIAMMASLASQIAASNLQRASRETNQAVMDLKACMDEILVQPPAALPSPGTKYADDSVIAAYSDLHLADELIRVDYPGYVAGGAVPNPLTIALSLTWTDYAGRARELTLSSMKTQ